MLEGVQTEKTMEKQFSNVVINDYSGDLSKRWYIYFSFQDPDTGKMKPFKFYISQKYKTRTSRYNEAAKLRDKYREKLKSGWTPYSNSGGEYTTLINAINYYLELRKPPVTRLRTYNTYRSHINFLISYLNKNESRNKYVYEFSKFDAQNFMQQTRIKQKHSNRTHNNLLTTMRALWTFFVKYEYCVKNIFLFVDTLMEEEPAIFPYTDDELSLITKTLPNHNKELWFIAQLIFYCFLRPQEIVRLKFENINIIGGFIITPGINSKGKKSNVIIIPLPFLNYLKTLELEIYPSDWFIFSKKLMPGPIEIKITRIDEAWVIYRDKFNLGNKKIYWLKHTGNGKAIDSEMNIRDIQTHNRHSSLEYTQKYILKLRPGAKNIAESFPEMNPSLNIKKDTSEVDIEKLIQLLSTKLSNNQST